MNYMKPPSPGASNVMFDIISRDTLTTSKDGKHRWRVRHGASAQTLSDRSLESFLPAPCWLLCVLLLTTAEGLLLMTASGKGSCFESPRARGACEFPSSLPCHHLWCKSALPSLIKLRSSPWGHIDQHISRKPTPA